MPDTFKIIILHETDLHEKGFLRDIWSSRANDKNDKKEKRKTNEKKRKIEVIFI